MHISYHLLALAMSFLLAHPAASKTAVCCSSFPGACDVEPAEISSLRADREFKLVDLEGNIVLSPTACCCVAGSAQACATAC
ncbi:hypothetical protein CPC08DRAFT_706794 [Agrocybe pediades]|nr:hypothetical protein CPC08DRAFT_706794 [Agrocybe pediades]